MVLFITMQLVHHKPLVVLVGAAQVLMELYSLDLEVNYGY
tara:strand:- start:324 stop:443 length:120 start_codon:yes stop_codon:yes gene_type:complete